MEFRLTTPEDAKDVMELQEALFPDDPIALTESDFATESFPTVKIVVAVDEEKMAGFVVLRNRSYRPWTGGDFIGIAEHAQGKGLGKTLVNFAFGHVSRPLFRIFVRPSNEAARSLYKSVGFFQYGRRKENYPDGDDAIILMRWCLRRGETNG